MPTLLLGLASNLVRPEKSRASPLSSSFEIKDSTKCLESRPLLSGAPGTTLDVDLDLIIPNSMDDIVKAETFSHETSQPGSPIPDVTPGDVSEIIINDDDDDLDKTIEDLQTPVAELTPRKKRTQDERLPCHHPPRSTRHRKRRLQHYLWRMTCPPVSNRRTYYPNGMTHFAVTTPGFTR